MICVERIRPVPAFNRRIVIAGIGTNFDGQHGPRGCDDATVCGAPGAVALGFPIVTIIDTGLVNLVCPIGLAQFITERIAT